MPLYDEEGNELEGALTPEEAKALLDKTMELEAKAKLADELDGKLKEKEAELSKLSTKDLNFQKLRDKSETEIEELKSKMSEKDKMILTEVMDLRKEKAELEQKVAERTKADVFKSLGVVDETSKAAVELALKEIGGLGNARTAEEIEAKYRTAYIVAKGEAPVKNPIFSSYTPGYREPDLTEKRFTETDTGKDSIRKWFPSIADKVLKDKINP